MSNSPYVSQLFDSAMEFARTGALEQAEAALTQVLETDPAHLRALDLMGYVQYFLKRPQAAQKYCEEALRIKPNHAYALKGLGLSMAACGRVEEGIRHLEKAISAAPQYFDTYWDLTITLAKAGRHRDAAEQLDLTLRTFPKQRERLVKLKRHLDKLRAADQT